MPLIVATVAAGQNLLSCDYLTRCCACGHAQVEWDCATKGYALNDLLIIDMLPTYGLLFYLLISVFVFVGCRGLRRRTSDRGLLRFAVGAFLVVSALGAVFAALVYIMAAPLAQPDMVDFYRMYRPGALIFLLGLFIIQFVFGVAAVYRGK